MKPTGNPDTAKSFLKNIGKRFRFIKPQSRHSINCPGKRFRQDNTLHEEYNRLLTEKKKTYVEYRQSTEGYAGISDCEANGRAYPWNGSKKERGATAERTLKERMPQIALQFWMRSVAAFFIKIIWNTKKKIK